MKYNAHINVELCNSIHSYTSLFTRVQTWHLLQMESATNEHIKKDTVDEIEMCEFKIYNCF